MSLISWSILKLNPADMTLLTKGKPIFLATGPLNLLCNVSAHQQNRLVKGKSNYSLIFRPRSWKY